MNSLPWVYLEVKDLCAADKCSPSSLYEKIKRGDCPPPEKHGTRSLWRSDVIAKWLDERSRKAQEEALQRAQVTLAKTKRLLSARQESRAA